VTPLQVAVNSDVPDPEQSAVLRLRPPKPIAELVVGSFQVSTWRQYVAAPAQLPSIDLHDEDEDEDDDDRDGYEAVVPLETHARGGSTNERKMISLGSTDVSELD
jgi:hypothetical protein